MNRTFWTTMAVIASLSLALTVGAQAKGGAGRSGGAPGGHAGSTGGGRPGFTGGVRAAPGVPHGFPGGVRAAPNMPRGYPSGRIPGVGSPVMPRQPIARPVMPRQPIDRQVEPRTGNPDSGYGRGYGRSYPLPMPVPGYGYPYDYPYDQDYPYGLDAPLPSGYQAPPCNVWDTVGDYNGQQVVATWDPYQAAYYYDDPDYGAVLVTTWPDSCAQ